jgi:hypothetical protein
MAKGLRSKVKKRLRTVKRGIIKKELVKPGSTHNDREVSKASKMAEALSGHILPGKKRKNAFRSDDADAEIPQYNWRQGPEFRSAFGDSDAGYAVWGSNRPKHVNGERGPHEQRPLAAAKPGQGADDAGLQRIMQTSEQHIPFMASKRTKKRIKNKSGVDVCNPAHEPVDALRCARRVDDRHSLLAGHRGVQVDMTMSHVLRRDAA